MGAHACQVSTQEAEAGDTYQDPVAKPKKIIATKRENKEDISPVGRDRFSHAKETKQMSKVRNARAS